MYATVAGGIFYISPTVLPNQRPKANATPLQYTSFFSFPILSILEISGEGKGAEGSGGGTTTVHVALVKCSIALAKKLTLPNVVFCSRAELCLKIAAPKLISLYVNNEIFLLTN